MQQKMEILFTKAQKSDAKAILEYLNIVGGESDNLLFGANEMTLSIEEEEKYIESINSQKSSALFMGKISGEIVCVGMVSSSPRPRIAHRGEVALSVKKSHWGKGVGSLLLEQLINFCRSNGVTKIMTLGVKAENESAIKLYNKFGFVEVGRHRDYFNIAGCFYDEILMDLHL